MSPLKSNPFSKQLAVPRSAQQKDRKSVVFKGSSDDEDDVLNLETDKTNDASKAKVTEPVEKKNNETSSSSSPNNNKISLSSNNVTSESKTILKDFKEERNSENTSTPPP